MDQVAYLVSHLRERDVQELREHGFTRDDIERTIRAPHVALRMIERDGKPACAIWFDAVTPKTLAASMLATDDWKRVAREAYCWAVKVCKPRLLTMGFVRAQCMVMDGHADAIRFLEHLGFTMETRCPQFGASGKAFLLYAWRLNDHVHVQITEDDDARSAAARGL